MTFLVFGIKNRDKCPLHSSWYTYMVQYLMHTTLRPSHKQHSAIPGGSKWWLLEFFLQIQWRLFAEIWWFDDNCNKLMKYQAVIIAFSACMCQMQCSSIYSLYIIYGVKICILSYVMWIWLGGRQWHTTPKGWCLKYWISALRHGHYNFTKRSLTA